MFMSVDIPRGTARLFIPTTVHTKTARRGTISQRRATSTPIREKLGRREQHTDNGFERLRAEDQLEQGLQAANGKRRNHERQILC